MSDASLHQVWSETELDDALDALHADAPSADLSAARATLLRAAGAAPAERVPDAKPRRTWAWVAAAAAVVVLAGGIVTVSNLPGEPAREPSLLELGSTGVVKPDAPLKPGEFRFLYEQRWGSPVYGQRYETTIELWLPDVPGQEWLRRETSTGRTLPYPGPDSATANAKPADGPPEVTEKYAPLDGGPGSFTNPTPAFLASLRQDPTWLYEQIQAWFGKVKPRPETDIDVFTFRTIVDLLTSGRLRADHRMLFARTLSLVPGFVTRTENDRTTYIFERGNERTKVVLQTSTGLPLSQSITTVYDADGYKAGTPLRESYYKTMILERPPIPTTTTTKPG
ncbi:hypothetical protein SAMN05421504_102304 [Amycolatopsis xylanica]|uniref:CU044_5270 family protein n=1 Tax=Amycolatopsis xylanica TaxID=589385 RepID=A0A1H2YXP7_9PSEU|nr:hypothetical protein [Amycolatopsis xylanica]SDX09906.1 hypothetical protein SAMN05421504_102304 [Amycolatopsis xylanica]